VNHISGTWELLNGQAGTIYLVRSPPVSERPDNPVQTRPVEIVAKEIPLASFRLYRSEVDALLAILQDAIPGPDVLISAHIQGSKVSSLAKDFFERKDLPPYLTEIKFQISSLGKGIEDSIIINVKQDGENNFVVQSTNATWTSGVSYRLSSFFESFSSRYLKLYRKYGLNLNTLAFIFYIALLPDLPLYNRFLFFGFVMVLLIGLHKVHRATLKSKVFLDNTRRAAFAKEWPTIYATIFGTIAAAALVGGFGLIGAIDLPSLTDLRDFFFPH
jgi:hypothetical protein